MQAHNRAEAFAELKVGLRSALLGSMALRVCVDFVRLKSGVLFAHSVCMFDQTLGNRNDFHPLRKVPMFLPRFGRRGKVFVLRSPAWLQLPVVVLGGPAARCFNGTAEPSDVRYGLQDGSFGVLPVNGEGPGPAAASASIWVVLDLKIDGHILDLPRSIEHFGSQLLSLQKVR